VIGLGANKGGTKEEVSREEIFNNILRIVTMLEEALNRLGRRSYHSRKHYPEVFLEIEQLIHTLRAWLQGYKEFAGVSSFSILSGLCIKELSQLLGELIEITHPMPGKRQTRKTRQVKEYWKLCETIEAMLENIACYLDKLRSKASVMSIGFEKAIQEAFERHCARRHKRVNNQHVSQRGNKTYMFAWSDKASYLLLVADRRRYRAEVLDKLSRYIHATGHKATCHGPKRYRLAGFRSNPRKPKMIGGKQEEVPIRMGQCVNCEERFSLLPSFLPREKHFEVSIIGSVFQGVLLFGQSIRAALEHLKVSGSPVKSKQTIFNWLMWIGTLHPATILTRAGVKGTGYLQEDEGFEKEPNLRTYAVVMVDPGNLLVWHADYVDRVDEESLCNSFQKFAQRATFKILGVTKDKWQPSTNALRKVLKSLWLGFCHRHYLKKFKQALWKYQQETQCSSQEVSNLFQKVKKILKTSSSQDALRVRVDALKDEAFKHPLLRQQLDELKKHAVCYTVNKRRKGIKQTTSIVDNFLKTVKRKLRQVESFRSQQWAQILFRAMANARNFIPFLSGAKNAHKSPFALAQGETHNLPWIQVMNIHNAFLFTPNAF
jgi:hypothetical protein